MSNINQTMTRIGRITINRDKNENGSWLLKVPQAAITALNTSEYTIGYGTSFADGSDVTIYMVGGGTRVGIDGTAIGIFFGTGLYG